MKTLPRKPSKLQARILRLLKKIAENGQAKMSTFQIAEYLGVPRSSVQKAIALLVAKEHITVTPGYTTPAGKKIPSVFTFPENHNGNTFARN